MAKARIVPGGTSAVYEPCLACSHAQFDVTASGTSSATGKSVNGYNGWNALLSRMSIALVKANAEQAAEIS